MTRFEHLHNIFHVLCIIAASSLITYWLYIFSLNEDLCNVNYKNYRENKLDEYPILSICLADFISDEKLLFQNLKINKSTYINFLKGKSFDPEFSNIEYNDIKKNISDYVVSIFHREENLKKVFNRAEVRKMLVTSFTGFWLDHFYHCYSLKSPQNEKISLYGIDMKSSVFPNSSRPETHGMMTILHYPGHLTLSGKTAKFSWPLREKYDKFVMSYQIHGSEVLKKRNKSKEPCRENSDNFDDTVLTENLDKVGCRAPYHYPRSNFPLCNSSNHIKRARTNLRFQGPKSIPPCRTMEQIYYSFEEKSIDGYKFANVGVFGVSMSFYNLKFKEILQTRYIISTYFKNYEIISIYKRSCNIFYFETIA